LRRAGCFYIFRTALTGGPTCQCQEFFWEQLTIAKEFLESLLLIGAEKARIVSRQHRREHAERVFVQFIGINWTKSGRYDRHGGSRCIAKVIEAHRIHAKGCVYTCYLRHFCW